MKCEYYEGNPYVPYVLQDQNLKKNLGDTYSTTLSLFILQSGAGGTALAYSGGFTNSNKAIKQLPVIGCHRHGRNIMKTALLFSFTYFQQRDK